MTYQSFNYVARAVEGFTWTSWLITAINFQVSCEICLGITKCEDLYTVLFRLAWNVLDEAASPPERYQSPEDKLAFVLFRFSLHKFSTVSSAFVKISFLVY